MTEFFEYKAPVRPVSILALPDELVPTIKARLAKKVKKSESGCLEWTGALLADGYGIITARIDGKSKNIGAHRAAWMAHRGPIPANHVIDHLCRVRHCINVEHLEPVTSYENTIRGHHARKNQPTISRPHWMEENLWTTARTVAAERGENLSDIIRAALVAYVSKWGNK